MRFAFKRSLSPVAYCALHVKAGTRYEDKNQGGLAHFTEHLLFKGTQTKSANTVNSFIERLGGELNAYTTKEETVIHATVLKEDLRKAVGLLMDIAFRCTFPDREIEKERGVVLEEINTYKDSPAEQIYDDFEEYMFDGTPLSMPVLGKARYLKKIDRDTVSEYYRKMFIPENMYFTIVADIEESRARDMVSKALDTYSTSASNGLEDGEGEAIAGSGQLGGNAPFEKSVSRHSHQAHCVIGARAYSAYDSRRIPLSLLVNILGGPMANSRLNLILREKYGLVYSVDASYGLYTDAGTATIYFGCEKANVQAVSQGPQQRQETAAGADGHSRRQRRGAGTVDGQEPDDIRKGDRQQGDGRAHQRHHGGGDTGYRLRGVQTRQHVQTALHLIYESRETERGPDIHRKRDPP